jgi:TPR repeat protein
MAASCGAPTIDPARVASPTALVVSCTDVPSCGLACREGRAETCATLAHFYETGQGVATNLTKAVELYAQGCRGYYVHACSHLAMLYDIGMGVPQDVGQAALLYEQACALGDAWACDRKASLRSGEL